MAFTVATAGMAAFAATAQAATLTLSPVQSCYLSGQQPTALGSGYTPNGNVNAAFGAATTTVTADAAGNIGLVLSIPGVKGIKGYSLAATDVTNTALTASVALFVTRLHVDVNPTHAAAGKKLRIKGYGLIGGKKVYMHVRGPGHYRSDTKLAKANAPCGTFKVRRKIVGAGARAGAYTVRFDAKKKYSKKTSPQTGGVLTITHTFSAVGARAAAFGGAGPIQRWTSIG
jgi:hypothetical protein